MFTKIYSKPPIPCLSGKANGTVFGGGGAQGIRGHGFGGGGHGFRGGGGGTVFGGTHGIRGGGGARFSGGGGGAVLGIYSTPKKTGGGGGGNGVTVFGGGGGHGIRGFTVHWKKRDVRMVSWYSGDTVFRGPVLFFYCI